MMQNITKNNHYVPQFYLRNWSPDSNTIYVYRTLVSDKKMHLWTQDSIVHLASHQHLYTITVDGEPSDYYDKWFNASFETPAQPAIEKVINGGHLTSKDYEILIQFLAVQIVRTPRWYDYLINNISRIFQTVPQETVDSLEDALHSGKLLPPTNPKIEPDRYQIHLKKLGSYNPDTLLYKAEIFVGQKMWLSEIREMLPKIISNLMKDSWCILEAPKDLYFPTSDDPVVCMGYRNSNQFWFDGVGIAQKNADIFMPLSPKHILFTEVGRRNKSRQIDINYFTLLHDMIIRHANRYVFSTEKIKGMFRLRKRTVDRELYKMEQENWKNWSQSQQVAERDWDSEE